MHIAYSCVMCVSVCLDRRRSNNFAFICIWTDDEESGWKTVSVYDQQRLNDLEMIGNNANMHTNSMSRAKEHNIHIGCRQTFKWRRCPHDGHDAVAAADNDHDDDDVERMNGTRKKSKLNFE